VIADFHIVRRSPSSDISKFRQIRRLAQWQAACTDPCEVEPMRIKIHRGTPVNGDDNLCESCSHSRIIRGRRVDEEVVVCEASHSMPTHVTFKVTTCSDYQDCKVPSYWELMQQAWILRPQSGKRPAGFVRASDLRDDEFSQFMAGLRDHDD
jgi:hypothetical protein